MADNVDHNVYAKIQTKDYTNRSLHWTHQYAMQEKITNPMHESTKPQKSVSDLQLIELSLRRMFRRALLGSGLFW